jgi:ABC-type transport system involved in multi-copper enzyme maturation permease subunit
MAVLSQHWLGTGPHGFYDLVRLARNGRSAVVRIVYILALFAALAGAFYTSTPPDSRRREESINWNARIAERFSATILVVQNLAVLVLTPIYMAGSIHEERDKGTFTLLFTTDLTAGEIVRGKWLSRCVQVGSVILAGLPVLAMVQLWGGIDMPMILANFINTAVLLLCVGAFSLVIAVLNKSWLLTLAKTYGFLALGFSTCLCMSSCFWGLPLLLIMPIGGGEDGYVLMWVAVFVSSAVFGGLTVWCLRDAGRRLEKQRQEYTPPIKEEAAIGGGGNRFRRWPAVPESVVAWKECYLDRSVWHIMPFALLPFLLCVLLSYMTMHVAGPGVAEDRIDGQLNEADALSCLFLLISVGVYILFVSFRLTGCIVRERQQRTLETILTLPIDSIAFLHQKLVGNLRRHWTWFVPAGVAWLFMVVLGHGRLAIGLVLPFVILVHLGFFAALGMFLSVTCRSALSAYISLGLVLVFLLFGVPIFFSFLDFAPNLNAWQRGLNPVHCWLTIAFEWRRSRPQQDVIVTCVFCYLLAALALWLAACWRFMRDPLGK